MTDIICEEASKIYNVGDVYYGVALRQQAKGHYLNVYTSWQCVGVATELSAGCRRYKYKFVLLTLTGNSIDDHEDCVVYTGGGTNELNFLSFDEFVEIVLIDQTKRGGRGTEGKQLK